MDSPEDRIYIDDMVQRLGRAAHTIRQWVRRADFPDYLKPQTEGGRNKLFWVEDQMDGLITYARAREAGRGSFGRTPA